MSAIFANNYFYIRKESKKLRNVQHDKLSKFCDQSLQQKRAFAWAQIY